MKSDQLPALLAIPNSDHLSSDQDHNPFLYQKAGESDEAFHDVALLSTLQAPEMDAP